MLMTQQYSETEPETENNQVLRDRDQNERDWDQLVKCIKEQDAGETVQSHKWEMKLAPERKFSK